MTIYGKPEAKYVGPCRLIDAQAGPAGIHRTRAVEAETHTHTSNRSVRGPFTHIIGLLIARLGFTPNGGIHVYSSRNRLHFTSGDCVRADSSNLSQTPRLIYSAVRACVNCLWPFRKPSRPTTCGVRRWGEGRGAVKSDKRKY